MSFAIDNRDVTVVICVRHGDIRALAHHAETVRAACGKTAAILDRIVGELYDREIALMRASVNVQIERSVTEQRIISDCAIALGDAGAGPREVNEARRRCIREWMPLVFAPSE